MVRLLSAFLIALLVAGSHAAIADEPRRVLILNAFGPRFAPFNAFANPFRQALVRQSPDPLAITEVSLEAVRDTAPEDDAVTLDYIRALYARGAPDLIVAIGGPAAHFAQASRSALFPATPLLVAATEVRRIDTAALTDRDVLAVHAIDLPAIVDTILEVQPDLRRLVLLLGASPLERLWQRLARQALAPYADRLQLEWTNDLDFDAILERAAGLPSDSAVLYGLMIVDAAGVPFEEDQAIAALSRASAAPIYGIYDSQLGAGVLGGRMLPLPEMSATAADAALRLLAGEPPRDVRVPVIGIGPPAFDSRQLVRFGIAETTLPPGSVVRFREPSAWDRHRWTILAAVALCLVQTAFITGLLASRRRLRRSEAALTASEARLRAAAGEAREFAGRLIRAQEDERSRLGRELHDDITQRLAVLAIDVGRCERQADTDPAALAGVREGLARLGSDVHALSYQLHPSILADLGLVAALEVETERMTRIEGLPVAFAALGVPAAVPRPVALCLYRVAQESLRNLSRHATASAARVTLAAEAGTIRLEVEDDGSGFDPDAVRHRPSLGLASMRQRVAAVGGTVRIDSRPGGGTRVTAELPLGGAEDDATTPAAG